MTQQEFFGAIEHNLQHLARGRGELPSYNLPQIGRFVGSIGKLKWLTRVKGFLCVSKADPDCPPNVRCYDLFSSKMPFSRRIMFRIFACYADDESTREGYRKAKRAIRRWYQASGRANSSEQPYAAAIVVGAASPWESGMTPNADDMPCDNVAFRMLVAPNPQPKRGIYTVKEGEFGACDTVCRALVPVTFDEVERLVRECVKGLFVDDISARGGGYLTIFKVREQLPMIPVVVVANIFNKMQAEGTHTTRKLPSAEGCESLEMRQYIVNRPPSWWRKMLSKTESEWYTQSKLCRVVSLGTLGSLLLLPLSLIEKISPELLFAHRWLVLAVCSGLVGLCLLLWLTGFLRRRL